MLSADNIVSLRPPKRMAAPGLAGERAAGPHRSRHRDQGVTVDCLD